MSSNRTIYVDFDDVLSETARAFTSLLERHFNKRVSFEEIVSFDLGISFDLDATEYERFMELAHAPEVLRGFKPIDGAVDALDELSAMGYEIAVMTGRPPSTAQVSKEWLEQQRVPYHSLTFVDKYGRGGFHSSDATVITLDELCEMHFCFAVEDSGDMAAYLAANMELPIALFDRPWNRDVQPSNPEPRVAFERCGNWPEIVDRFGRRQPHQGENCE